VLYNASNIRKYSKFEGKTMPNYYVTAQCTTYYQNIIWANSEEEAKATALTDTGEWKNIGDGDDWKVIEVKPR
jgi:hypothetical protein